MPRSQQRNGKEEEYFFDDEIKIIIHIFIFFLLNRHIGAIKGGENILFPSNVLYAAPVVPTAAVSAVAAAAGPDVS